MEVNESVEAANYTTSISLGDFIIPKCSYPVVRVNALGYPLAAVNFLSAVANVFHMIILSRMPSLKGTNYYHILLHLSIGDLHTGVSVATFLIFNNVSYFKNATIPGLVLYDVLLRGWIPGKYWMMVAASVERYLALCKPMTYEVSTFATKLYIWLPLIWIGSLVYAIIITAVFHEHLCFSDLVGPILTGMSGVGTARQVELGISALIVGILLTRVFVEIVKMGKRSTSQQEKDVRKAALYLGGVIISFYFCLVPAYIGYVVFLLTKKSTPLSFYVLQLPFSSLYGIFNTIVYGWITPGYRKQVRTLFRCFNQVNAANP
jgi:hypothetical protein